MQQHRCRVVTARTPGGVYTTSDEVAMKALTYLRSHANTCGWMPPICYAAATTTTRRRGCERTKAVGKHLQPSAARVRDVVERTVAHLLQHQPLDDLLRHVSRLKTEVERRGSSLSKNTGDQCSAKGGIRQAESHTVSQNNSHARDRRALLSSIQS